MNYKFNSQEKEKFVFICNSVLLIFVAGLVNSVAILGIHGSSVAHITGSASAFAIDFSQSKFTIHLLLLVLIFFLGSLTTGLFIGSIKFRKENRYGSLFILESFILVIGSFLFLQNIVIGDYAFSFACGLQNAVVMTYRGSIIRTTHITGIVTDLGSYLGNKIRGVEVESWRLYLNFLQVFGFLIGSFFGSYYFLEYGIIIIWIPAFVCFSIGVSFKIWKNYSNKFIDV